MEILKFVKLSNLQIFVLNKMFVDGVKIFQDVFLVMKKEPHKHHVSNTCLLPTEDGILK